MTTINATINSLDFSGAAKRIDIWHEGGGIGHWELLFDNITGASQLLYANLVASNLGINGVNLMAGYVDDVLPEVAGDSLVFCKYVKATGRNYGRDLANLFHVGTYADKRFDDLVDDVLAYMDSEITFTSPHTAPFVDIDFNKTFLQNGFVEAANRIGYDFKVDNAKALTMWALASAPSSGITLKAIAGETDNNILLINPQAKAGVDIRNNIRIDAGTVDDHWTAGNAVDFDSVGGTVADDTSVYIRGASSIKLTSTDITTELSLTFPLYNHSYLAWDLLDTEMQTLFVAHDASFPYFNIILTDDDDNVIIWKWINPAAGTWHKITFPVGRNVPFSPTEDFAQWHYITGSNFTWRIKKFTVQCILPTGGPYHWWLDGLQFPSVPVYVWAVSVPSQNTYGKRMIPLTRTDVKSQLQLQAIADNELANRKDPITKLTLTCTLQTGLLYAGYTVGVLAPDSYIGYGSTPDVYRILSIHHAAESGVDLCKGHDAITVLELILHEGGVGADPTRFKLASEPQAAINVRSDARLRVLESSLTGSGSVLGGGGGGGVDWGNVPYIHVVGFADFLAQVQLQCDWEQLDYATILQKMYRTATNEPADHPFDPRVSELRFKDDITENYANIFSVLFTEPVTTPFVVFDQGIACRKDILCTGIIGSFEGIIALWGGQGALPNGFDNNPVIMLNDSAHGKDTLEILLDFSGTLGKIKVDTIYTDNLKKVNGDIWINQILTKTSDAIFNNVLVTATVGFKLGVDGGSVYGAIGFDAENVYVTAYGRHLYLATETGKDVYILKNLNVTGTIQSTAGYKSSDGSAGYTGALGGINFKNGLAIS